MKNSASILSQDKHLTIGLTFESVEQKQLIASFLTTGGMKAATTVKHLILRAYHEQKNSQGVLSFEVPV